MHVGRIQNLGENLQFTSFQKKEGEVGQFNKFKFIHLRLWTIDLIPEWDKFQVDQDRHINFYPKYSFSNLWIFDNTVKPRFWNTSWSSAEIFFKFCTKALFICKTHFRNHALKKRFLFSRRVFLRVVSRSVVCRKTRFLLNKKRVFKAWFQKCVL